MIKKILFTLFVAAAVLVFYKLKNSRESQPRKPQSGNADLPQGRLTTSLMAYVIVGFMLIFSGIYFFLNWLDDRSLMTVRVTGANHGIIEYQVRKSAIKGRRFSTTDGRIIELGDDQQLEIFPATDAP